MAEIEAIDGTISDREARKEGVDSRAGLSGPAVTRTAGKKDRRASVVIKETAQLLTGLHEDADRGEALMAELEALLAAAQSTTGQPSSDEGVSDVDGADARPIPHFAAVQPIQIEDESEEVCPTNFDDSGPVPQAPASPILKSVSDKRRSSVVTFDGAVLLGALPPAGSGPPSAGPRSQSVNRARGLTSQAGNRTVNDFKSGPALRRNALTDMGAANIASAGGPQPHQPLQQQNPHQGGRGSDGSGTAPQYPLVTGLSGTSSGPSAAYAGAVRRSTNSEGIDFSSYVQTRRASSTPYASPFAMSQGQVFVGTGICDSVDGGLDSLGLGLGPGGGVGVVQHVPSPPITGPAASGALRMGAGGGGGGGRFLKILKGIFHSNNGRLAPLQLPGDGPPSSPASPVNLHHTAMAYSTASSPGIGPDTPAPPPAAGTLESALTYGALSSMTVRAPSRSQLLTRGSATSASFTSLDPRRLTATQQRVGGAPGMAASPLLVGRSPSVTSGVASPHALVPTPPSATSNMGRDASGTGMYQSMSGMSGVSLQTQLACPTASAGISPASPSTTLYGMMSPSAVDCRLAGTSSRRSLMASAAGGRGQW